jgi:pentatricopeptide repeat protein
MSSAKAPIYDSSRKFRGAVITAAIVLVFGLDAFFGDLLWNVISCSGNWQKSAPQLGLVGSMGMEVCIIAISLLLFTCHACYTRWYSKKPAKRTSPTQPSAQTQPSPDDNRRAAVHKWRTAIEQAAREGSSERARTLFSEMVKSGVQPDESLPNIVMTAFAKSSDFTGAESWLLEMQAKRLETSACTYNTIMDACAKANRPKLCEAWLSKMVAAGITPTVVSFTTVVSAYAHHGDKEKAESTLLRMKASGLQPDLICYNALIHACSVCGNLAGVEYWMNDMSSQGIVASVPSYTSAIDACAKLKDVPQAEMYLKRMLAAGLEPNVVSFGALMDACAESGEQDRARFWYDRMVEVGIKPNSHSFCALIKSCNNTGDVAMAEKWLAAAEAAVDCLDPVVYSAVINVCGKANDADRAWKVFQHLRARGVRPHIVLFAALARPFAYRGDIDRVEEIARLMEHYDVASNEYFLYAHLLAVANSQPVSNRPQLAEAVFRKALSQGVNINARVVSALARAVGRQRADALGKSAKQSQAPWHRRA